MIQVSDAYKELVKSNIRPKCEPIIKVSGKDNNGNVIELIWQAKNIKDLKYKRGIDPVGRELPYMELTWTEIYTGKLNAENYPEKYNNIAKYMKVELSFVQDLGFYNTWKTLFASGISWKELFESGINWKQLKNQVSQETITMPKMFLSAKPTISGQTITWKARDFLFFLEDETLEDCNPSNLEIPFLNPIFSALYAAEFKYNNVETIKNMILKTMENFDTGSIGNDEILYKRIIANTSIKNFLLKYCSTKNYYLVFLEDGSCHINFLDNVFGSTFKFSKNIMFNNPKITYNTNISSYEFKQYKAELNHQSNYTKSYTRVETYSSDGTPAIYRFDFDGYGATLPEFNANRYGLLYEVSYALDTDPSDVVVTPIKINSYNYNILSDAVGETFIENNDMNPYDEKSNEIKSRNDFLKKYFTSNKVGIEFECLPIFHIELGDGIYCETNLIGKSGGEIIKRGFLVSQEISYNGSFKQKNFFHEYEIGLG